MARTERNHSGIETKHNQAQGISQNNNPQEPTGARRKIARDFEQQRKKNRPKLFEFLVTEAVMAFGYPRLDRITRRSGLEFAEGFEDVFAEAVADGDLILLISNHDSLYNVHSMSLVTNELTLAKRSMLNDQRVSGYNIPAAASLITGDQGYFDRRAAEKTERTINKRHLRTIAYTREKDTDDYETPENQEEVVFNLRQALKSGEDFAMFAEGGMGSGEGMRPFNPPDAISKTIRVAHTAKRRVTIVPIGIEGGDEVLPPHKRPTNKAYKAAFFMDDPHMVDIKVGLPIREVDNRETFELAVSRDPGKIEQFNFFIGTEVSKLIRYERRGYYAEGILEPGVPSVIGRK